MGRNSDCPRRVARSQARLHALVVGSGVGGLSAAAALANQGLRVAVLESHSRLGGLTQTFRRNGYVFPTGVHYVGNAVGELGGGGVFYRVLRDLTGGEVEFAPVGSPYDVVRLPGLDFPVEAPKAAYVARLKETFPHERRSIDRYFRACEGARRGNRAVFAVKAMPEALGVLVKRLCAPQIRRALETTVAQAVEEVRDPRLAALLTARWGTYGIPPARAPLAVHSLVTGGFSQGAWYPVGGPDRISEALGHAVAARGGVLHTNAAVSEILSTDGRVTGVRLAGGEVVRAPVVISAMGARNTARALPDESAGAWKSAVEALEPGICCVCLYLGLRGDIRRHHPSRANVWIYETLDTGRVWERPGDEDAPSLFVSFSSLKDPAHRDRLRHTVEVVAFCRWEAFSPWAESTARQRPKEYEAVKDRAGAALLGQFSRHFPELAAHVDVAEVSTPLSQASFVGAESGAMYGLAMTPERLLSPALRVRTPVSGLLLAGQDAASPGVEGAFLGGLLAAATASPRLWWSLLPRPASGVPGFRSGDARTAAEPSGWEPVPDCGLPLDERARITWAGVACPPSRRARPR